MNKADLAYMNDLLKESSGGLYLDQRKISYEWCVISEWDAEVNLGNDK